MDISPTTILLVGVVCVILGFLASVLVNTLSEENEPPAGGTDEAPPGGKKGRYTPVFRVWREKESGALIVEMDGKAMTAPSPLNQTQRERLESTVRDLRGWLGMGLAGTQSSQADNAPVAQAPRPAIPTAPPVVVAQAAKAADERGMAAGEAVPARAISYSPPARMPVSTSTPAAQPPAPKGKEEPAAAPVSKSIVLQIEDILQDMIAGTDLEQRDVHLLEDPIRGVVVQIGIEHFEGIDAVPDPYIKGIIQSAVQEWEKTQ